MNPTTEPKSMATLLDTISGDDALEKRLASMPADAKTLTLSLDAGGVDLQHPSWSAMAMDSAELQQTIDTPLDFASLRADEGFVPGRKVVSLGRVDVGRVDLGTIGNHAPTLNCPTLDDAEYRLVGKLGSGGTGIVYQAHQRAIDREVAVKVLRHELACDRLSRHRFLSEARVIGSLDHPNVIALHDLCIDGDGHLFYAMKRIDGTSWDQQLDDFSVEENLSILLRIADAIRYAHSRGLIHRDIKPENVMLGRFGEALVADWGLAIAVNDRAMRDSGASSSESSSAIGGTPAYMAPEQAMGDVSSITTLTDVYLLGAILYQILTGRPPHHGANLLLCVRAAANNEIQPTEVVGELIEAAMKAMATQPQSRYQSVEEFVLAITDHRTHQESERLVRRATRRVWPPAPVMLNGSDVSKPTTDAPPESVPPQPESIENAYERFRVGLALLHEAIELWPENAQATAAQRRVQLEFARFAAGQGDLDLSLRMYGVAGQSDCEAAVRVQRDRDQRDRVRESQAKYSALFTQSPEAGLLIRWTDGVVLEANPACVQMLGYELGELMGKTIADLTFWACPERRAEFVQTLNDEGRVDNFETQFLRKGDTAQQRIDVLISSATVEVNGVEMLLSTIRDISQRRDAERNLEQSRRRLRDLQRLAGLGTWSYDPETKVIHWSEETFRLVGRDPQKGVPTFEELIHQIHPDDRTQFNEVLRQALEHGASYQIHFRQIDDDGNYRSLKTRGRPVLDDHGQTIEIYGILLEKASCE